jgi:nucleoid-associated protein YejK
LHLNTQQKKQMNQEQRQQELLLMQAIHETCLSQYLTKEEAVSQLYHYKPEQVKLGTTFINLTTLSLG